MSYKNIVASIGTYQKDGQTKYINRTVGKLVETQHGPKITLDASFNPAGCIRSDDGSVWLSLFDPKPKDFGRSDQQDSRMDRGMQAAANNDFEDNDLPF